MTATRTGTVLLLAFGACFGGLLAAAPVAGAHPLGNATVNHYDGLRLSPDLVTDTAVVDVAEIPTLQRKPLIDGDGNGRLSAPELGAYARRQCADLAAGVRISVGPTRLALRVERSEYGERPGAAGLPAGRLECRLTAPTDLSAPVAVTVEDEWDGAGLGWHELTAVGTGVSLLDSPVPARSISDELRRYPNDLLSSPLDQRSATLRVAPGDGASTYAGARGVPTAGAASRLLDRLSTAFDGLVGRQHLTVGVGLLAVLLAVVLGAGHALLPGHGKTIMAAYLVGRRGRLRDVLAVGATVTVTHTAGVLVVGLLLSVTATLAPTAVVRDLAVLSGLIVAGVGLYLLVTVVRRRRRGITADDELATLTAAAEPEMVSAGPHAHAHTHDHGHDHDQGHFHHHSHPHEHGHEHRPDRFGRGGLVGLGVAGGLVPSPSALLVLLAAIALGRTVFGVVLVLGYGVGMAVVLTAAGLLLLRLRGRLGRLASSPHARRIVWLARALPALTAVLVLVVGIGLVLQALSGSV